ncbi:MAG: glycosyltransferase family 39 protein [Planctomycetaceae bacterium]|nr:glycosyltransferase family 39 protein [Planctomycetaceae bacterium]
MRHKQVLSLAAILALYAVGIIAFSQCRTLDRDEGYYAAAARLVAEGKAVYGDFFYPQAPALPYLYALADRAGGSLATLRLVSAVASILMVLLWSVYLASRHRGTPKVVVLGLLLVALDPHLAYWNATVKTFAVGNLLLTAALVSLYFAVERNRKLGYAVSGLCSGVLVSVRLLYAPIAPIIFGWLLWRGFRHSAADEQGLECHRLLNDARQRTFSAMSYLAGFVLGGAPFLWMFLSNPRLIAFNNLGYHALRATPPGWLDRVGYVLKFVAIDVCDPYLVMGVGLAIVGLCSGKAKGQGGFIALTAVLAAVFVVGTASPYPLNAHYFTGTLAVFLMPAAAVGITTIRKRGVVVVGGLMLVSGLSMLLTSPFVARVRQHFGDMASVYAPSGTADGRVATGNVRSEKSLASFRAVSRYIESVTRPDDVVLSVWPGYVYESGRRFFPGLENDFGLAVSGRLSAEDRNAYKIAGREEVLAAIRGRSAGAVVIGGYWMDDCYPQRAERKELVAALEGNYALGREIDGIKVFVPCKRRQ